VVPMGIQKVHLKLIFMISFILEVPILKVRLNPLAFRLRGSITSFFICLTPKVFMEAATNPRNIGKTEGTINPIFPYI